MSNETKGNYTCPECYAPLRIWTDIAACLFYQVTSDGQLINPYIHNYPQGTSHACCMCSECSWASFSGCSDSREIGELLGRISEKANELRLMEDTRSETQTLGRGGEA